MAEHRRGPSGPERGGGRPYSRLDRVNEALREVIADELERVDDDRLEMVTVTGIRVDPDFRRALVWFSSLSGLNSPDEVVVALAQHRVRLQAAVGRQLRLKHTPELLFQSDPAIAVGTRVDEILRALHQEGSATSAAGEPGARAAEEDDDE